MDKLYYKTKKIYTLHKRDPKYISGGTYEEVYLIEHDHPYTVIQVDWINNYIFHAYKGEGGGHAMLERIDHPNATKELKQFLRKSKLNRICYTTKNEI